MDTELKKVALNESTGALAYARHYYGSQAFPASVTNLLGRLEKIRLAALKAIEEK